VPESTWGVVGPGEDTMATFKVKPPTKLVPVSS
jgi:hypothetical protein